MTYKIALTSSGPLSGKTTLAKHLESEYGFTRADHSRSLVQDFVDMWNNPIHDPTEMISIEQVYADKEVWRPLLQQFGYAAGYNVGQGAAAFIKKTIMRSGWAGDDLVYEPFRGEEQASVLRSMGFTLVQLEIGESTREFRAEAIGVDYDMLVRSMQAYPELETGIKNPDITIHTDYPDADLWARIILSPVTWVIGDRDATRG